MSAQQSTTGMEIHKRVTDKESNEAVELLRYVTSYATPVDVIQDITHMIPLLTGERTDAGGSLLQTNASKSHLRFYNYVDTWASGPGGPTLWENNAKTSCQSVKPGRATGDQRNGFESFAEILLWPEEEKTKDKVGRVTEVIPVTSVLERTDAGGSLLQTDASKLRHLQPSPFGGPLLMGQPHVELVHQMPNASLIELSGGSGHELVRGAGSMIQLEEGERARVFACEEPGDVSRSMRFHPSDHFGASFVEKVNSMKNKVKYDIGEYHKGAWTGDPNMIRALLPSDAEKQGWTKGAQVYSRKTHPDGSDDNHTPMGVVHEIEHLDTHGGSPTALVQITAGCPCEEDTADAFALAVARRTHEPSALVELGVAVAGKDGKLIMSSAEEMDKHEKRVSDQRKAKETTDIRLTPAFIEVADDTARTEKQPILSPTRKQGVGTFALPTSEYPVKPLVSVSDAGLSTFLEMSSEVVEEGEEKEARRDLSSAKQVCVMRMPTDQLAKSQADFGEVKPGEVIMAHVKTTGHGWEHTQDKCGEFCEASYLLQIDGETAGEAIEPWRNDCGENPNNNQQGTWPIPRNGWCPGAVHNGAFVDVTDLVKKKGGGVLPIDFKTHSVKGEAGTYSNMPGFAFDDKAMLQTSVTFHRYEDPALHQALLEGGEATVQRKANSRNPPYWKMDGSTGRGTNGPWHEYSQAAIDADPPMYRIPVLTGDFVQLSTRLLTTAPIEAPKNLDTSIKWRGAVHFNIGAPSNRDFIVDEWDRVGGFGILGHDPEHLEQLVGKHEP